MKNNTFTNQISIDYTIPTWQEMGPYIFFSSLAGFALGLLIFLYAVYIV